MATINVTFKDGSSRLFTRANIGPALAGTLISIVPEDEQEITMYNVQVINSIEVTASPELKTESGIVVVTPKIQVPH
jgi:hypothetical protein